MSGREGVTGGLAGLVVVWIGATATLAVVTAQERPVEVSSKASCEGANPDTGEIFRGDVLSGAAKEALLKAHNDARKKIGLGPVAWSDDIADYALDWIIINKQSYLAAAREEKLPLLKHRPQEEGKTKQKYGENMACLRGPASVEASAPTQAVAAWLEEKAAFDKLNAQKPYVVGDETGKTDHKGEHIRVGHYTQIVWRDTQKIGAAKFEVTLNGKRTTVIVCNYDPRGNSLGQKPY